MKDINVTLFSVLSILSLFAALLFVFQIYFLKEKKISDKYFSFYLLNIAFIITYFLIIDLALNQIAIALIPFLTTAVLLIGPFLWMYVKSVVIVDYKKNNKKHMVIPLVTGLLSLILLVLAYAIKDEYMVILITQALTYLTLFALTALFILQNSFYIFKSLRLYRKHLKRVGNEFSYTEKVNLSWFKLLIYGYIVFIVGLILMNIVHDLWSDILYNGVMLSYIIYAGYNALQKQPTFKTTIKKEEDPKNTTVDVSSDFFKELKEKLLQILDEEKLFLDHSLTIHSLTKKLDTNSKYLSQLINNEFGKSFVVFINEYRIKEAKELLLDDRNKNITIEAIGDKAGFKSKSSFHTAFKKFTGETPSSFVKRQNV